MKEFEILTNDMIKKLDSDSLLSLLERIGQFGALLSIEAAKRASEKKFTDDEIERMCNITTSVTAYVYDELGITKEQMQKNNEIMEETIFSEGR